MVETIVRINILKKNLDLARALRSDLPATSSIQQLVVVLDE
jgi:hypothetical protein